MAEFFQEVKQLHCQLDIKDQKMVDITLHALPKSYDPLQPILVPGQATGPVLFVDLEALLLQEQERIQCRRMAQEENHKALLAAALKFKWTFPEHQRHSASKEIDHHNKKDQSEQPRKIICLGRCNFCHDFNHWEKEFHGKDLEKYP